MPELTSRFYFVSTLTGVVVSVEEASEARFELGDLGCFSTLLLCSRLALPNGRSCCLPKALALPRSP